MILGHPTCFSKEHYENHRGLAPAELCELVVHCLELVSQLAHGGLAYRFKGGNSLLLLLEQPRRFSIDVDIVTTESKERLTSLVDQIVRGSDVFTRWEARQPKTKPWLPLISYKLFFRSAYCAAEEPFVMLDAVLEPAPYPGVIRKVRCSSLYVSDKQVEVPCVSGLIGDKLLAIGPSTLGIPVGKGKQAQRLKHVFDVSLLLQQPHELLAVRQALWACQVQEQRIQGREFAWEEIVGDTVRFCTAACGHEVPPDPSMLEPGSYLHEIAVGFEQFRRHLFSAEYSWSALAADFLRVTQLLESLGPA